MEPRWGLMGAARRRLNGDFNYTAPAEFSPLGLGPHRCLHLPPQHLLSAGSLRAGPPLPAPPTVGTPALWGPGEGWYLPQQLWGGHWLLGRILLR